MAFDWQKKWKNHSYNAPDLILLQVQTLTKQIDKFTSDFNQQSAIFHRVFIHNMVHWELFDISACRFAPVKEFIN